jgi:hypothetical protein
MTKSKLHNALLAVALAGGVFAGAGSAYATPDTEFFATNLLTFGAPTPTTAGGTFVSTTSTELEWVQESDAHSFLRILPPANVLVPPISIVSDTGTWTDIAQIQHENNVIAISEFGFTVDVTDQFTLTGATFDVTGDDTLDAIFGVLFTETPNVSPESACGEPNPLESLCDDTFVISNLAGFLDTFLFSANGERWAISFRILAEELEGSSFNGTDTVFTAEDFTSNLFIQARIDQVPEPGTIALLGIGLLGLPLVRARRAAKKADTAEA